MQDQNHAYYQACGEDDLSREVGEVAAHQDACHQAVAVADDHQPYHCLVAEVASQGAWNLRVRRSVHH